MILRAIELGVQEIAYTEHVNARSPWFDEFADIVDNLRAKYKHQITVYLGIETKVLDFAGSLDCRQSMIDRADIVLASVHNNVESGGEFKPEIPAKGREMEFRAIMGMFQNPDIQVIGHAGALSLLHAGGFPSEYFETITEACKKSGKAFELNAGYHIDVLPYLVSTCKLSDVSVSLGSNSHSVQDLSDRTLMLHADVQRLATVS
jgi:histidinol phosphatase-like PHP family hydrolase